MASSTHRLSELKKAAKELCCDAQQPGMRIKAENTTAGGLAEGEACTVLGDPQACI